MEFKCAASILEFVKKSHLFYLHNDLINLFVSLTVSAKALT